MGIPWQSNGYDLALTQHGIGSTPGHGTKIPQASGGHQKQKKNSASNK